MAYKKTINVKCRQTMDGLTKAPSLEKCESVSDGKVLYLMLVFHGTD